MRAAVYEGEGRLVVRDVPDPVPAPDEVLVEVEACGICGSDLHFWHGDLPRPIGTAPGHEFAGTVIDGPSGLADVRYAVSPNVSCGRCEFCTTGRSNLCRRGGYGIGLGRNGGLSEIADAPLVNLAPIPEGVDPVIASLTEPLAVTVRGVGLAHVEPDTKVLVLGAGTIGLCAALVARDRAASVTITARHPHQRDAAARVGVDVLGENDAVAWAKEEKPDVVIETVGGAADTMDDALRAVRRGGKVVVLGSFNDAKPVDLRTLMMKEVALLGSFCYGSGEREPEFATAARLTGRFRDELRAITTHQFGLDDVATAFDTANDKSTGAIKVTLVP